MSKKIYYRFCAITKSGTNHLHNEDRILVCGTTLSNGKLTGKLGKKAIAILCDGVGGEAHGEYAASIITEHFKKPSTKMYTQLDVTDELFLANEELLSKQCSDIVFQNMSTTIVGIAVFSNRFVVFNAGDSRAYLFQKGNIRRLSKDHTLSQEMNIRGIYLCLDFVKQPFTNSLTRYLGGDGAACCPSVYIGEIPSASYCFFLCSDGIHRYVSEKELSRVLSSSLSINKKSRAILDLAIKNGSDDDVSLILMESL